MKFKEVTGWGDDSWDRDVTGVAVDSHDRVYVLRRGEDAVTVLHPDGRILMTWGKDRFSGRPHLISIDERDTVHVADDGGHRVFLFDIEGNPRETIGTGLPSATGFDDPKFASAEVAFERMPGGPPFNRPTKAVSARTGELFVSDGYRNCRIHKFSPDRRSVQSWGAAGAAPGCFVIPHSVTLDHEGRMLVSDRENDRIQIFSQDGALVDIWTDVQRPTDVAFDRQGNIYVTELARGPLDLKSWRLGRAKVEKLGRVSVWSPQRELLARIEMPEVEFLAPHAIAVDSQGSVYVSEVPESFATSTKRPQRKHCCLRKFERI